METFKPFAYTSSEVKTTDGNSNHNLQEKAATVRIKQEILIKMEPIYETDEIGEEMNCYHNKLIQEALNREIEIHEEPLLSDNEGIVEEGIRFREKTADPYIHKSKHLSVEIKRIDMELYTCKYCNRIFLLNTELRMHEKSHRRNHVGYIMSNTGKYQCNLCGKSFSRHFAIKTHVRKNNCMKKRNHR